MIPQYKIIQQIKMKRKKNKTVIDNSEHKKCWRVESTLSNNKKSVSIRSLTPSHQQKWCNQRFRSVSMLLLLNIGGVLFFCRTLFGLIRFNIFRALYVLFISGSGPIKIKTVCVVWRYCANDRLLRWIEEIYDIC